MELVAPEKAEPPADRRLTLMPGAGHVVHMPSHIDQRVGRYADSASSNELAILADEDYISQCRAQGLDPMGYYPHNIHFLWFAATMEGRSEVALEAARKVAAQVDDAPLAELPHLAGFRVVPDQAFTRFGRWEDMLAEPAPPAANLYLTACGATAAAWRTSPAASSRRRPRSCGRSSASPPIRRSPSPCSRRTAAVTRRGGRIALR